MKKTLGDAKRERIPEQLSLCRDDAKVVSFINEAQQRLLQRPEKFWGTYARYRCNVYGKCLTWPRHFATLELAAVNNTPVVVRNLWFEFLESGWGIRDCDSCDLQMLDKGNSASFEDICGTHKKIKVYCDVPETSGSRILLQGYDQSGNWIRTLDAGTWVDGEYVLLNAATPQMTANVFSAYTGAIKPLTNGTVRLYEYDTTTATQRPIAIYEWDEEVPNYRRSFIPGLTFNATTGYATVEVIAKLDHIPVRNDNDYLIIGNIPALKEMCLAIKHYEENAVQLGQLAEARAVQLMKNEARHYEGSGKVVPLRMEGENWGVGNMPQVY